MSRILVTLLFCLLAAPSYGDQMPERQCAITAASPQDSPCPPLNPFLAIGTADFDAVRSDAGQAAAPIDVWNRCRYVDNSDSTKSVFVPFKSQPEWDAFIGGYPEYVGLATCARPETKTILPNGDCLDPSPASYAVNLPYARTGVVMTENRSFSCAPPEDGCPGWTQTVQAQFTALNSDVSNPSWSAGNPIYDGESPDPSECAQDGACGGAHGVAVPTQPTSSLCGEGTPSTVTGSGPWNWTCAGTGGGATASCSAPKWVNGTCGPANGVAVTTKPTSGLCAAGTPSAVAGSGPWTWTCAGANGGATASCSAPKKVNGTCGPANGVATSIAPSSGLCNTGTPSAVVFNPSDWGEVYWSWSCAGINGGSTASCSAPVPAGWCADWTPRESVRLWSAIDSSPDGTKLAASSTDQIYASTDSGVTWTAKPNPAGLAFDPGIHWHKIAISADGTRLGALLSSGQIYTSADSGLNWTARESSWNWPSIEMSDDGMKLFVGRSSERFLLSTDGGGSWVSTGGSDSPQVHSSGIAISPNGNILAGANYNGKIHISTNGGVSWTAYGSDRAWWDLAMSADGTKLAAIVPNGQIYTSANGGVTWTARESNRNWVAIASSANGTILAAAEHNGKIYVSTDSGVTWTPQGCNQPWMDITLSADGTKAAAVPFGGNIYTAPISGP